MRIICPAGLDPRRPLCCPPNIYNPLIWLAETACVASPFTCAPRFDNLCIRCLQGNPEIIEAEDRNDNSADEI